MKKIFVTVMMLFMLIALAACNSNETESNDSYNFADINQVPYAGTAHETHNMELKIQIDVATDEFLSAFANLHHASIRVPGQDEGTSLVIWANQTLSNFSVVALASEWLEDTWGFKPTYDFGAVSALLPGEAFVIENYMGAGTMPHRGISFTDTNGENTRVFFFQENHAYPEHGGQWIIQEIEADRLIWGFSYDVDMPSENGYPIVINGVGLAGDVYTIPHPLAIALQNFIAGAEGETKALVPHVNGTLGVLAIEFVDNFAEATLFVFTGFEVIYKELGSIEGFPFSVGFTTDGWGNLVKTTGDGGNWSYTMFGVATNPATRTEEIIYIFTIYAESADDGSINYYRFDGGWLEGIEGGRHAITEEAFYEIRSGMGDSITSWRESSWDNTESILAWVVRL